MCTFGKEIVDIVIEEGRTDKGRGCKREKGREASLYRQRILLCRRGSNRLFYVILFELAQASKQTNQPTNETIEFVLIHVTVDLFSKAYNG